MKRIFTLLSCFGISLSALLLGAYYFYFYQSIDYKTLTKLQFNDYVAAEDIDAFLAEGSIAGLLPDGNYYHALSRAHMMKAGNAGLFSEEGKKQVEQARFYLVQGLGRAPLNSLSWYQYSFTDFLKTENVERMVKSYDMSVKTGAYVPYVVYPRMNYSALVLPFASQETRKKVLNQVYTAWQWDAEMAVAYLPPTLALDLLEESMIGHPAALMELQQLLKQ